MHTSTEKYEYAFRLQVNHRYIANPCDIITNYTCKTKVRIFGNGERRATAVARISVSVSQASAVELTPNLPAGVQCGETLGEADSYSGYLPFPFLCPEGTLARFARVFQPAPTSMAIAEVDIFVIASGQSLLLFIRKAVQYRTLMRTVCNELKSTHPDSYTWTP